MAKTTKLNDCVQSFYDIESLDNVYSLCNFRYNENLVDVYFIVDDKLDTQGGANNEFVLTDEIKTYISERIYLRNKNFSGTIRFHYLSEYDNCIHLLNTFGAKDDTGLFERLAATNPNFHMFVNDTDTNYSADVHSFFFGYNSDNYDLTMHSLWATETFWVANGQLRFTPVTARQMRDHNNNLFTPQYIDCMPSYLQRTAVGKYGTGYSNRENTFRNNMKQSGRHLDVSSLNEKMQKVALKRLLGMLGYQILESNKLKPGQSVIYTVDELAELIAYNVSDCVNLRNVLINKTYRTNFELKKGLLDKYPELIYNKYPDKYAPDIRPDNVRRDRLFIDSSSAKFASKALCPYGHLNDMETVSFMYPSENKAKELGIPRVNVLDECRKFFYSLYPDNPKLQAEFDRIYFYYKNNVEGHNFNNSKEYAEYWSEKNADKHVLPAYSMKDIPKCNLTLPYFCADGTPSSGYVVFGAGGIHGAEYNKTLFEADLKEYEALKSLHELVRAQHPDPLMLKQKDPKTKKAWSFTYNGKEYKSTEFLKAGSTATNAEWKDLTKKKPKLFKSDPKGGFKLNKRYVYTSADNSNHEDFTSYYPNLLIMMEAFKNEGLGYDRYAEIFDEKQLYGKYMKDKSRPESERDYYANAREGTKLVINSASGVGDAQFYNPIRMNNTIISMRIIGQLFTFRIGEAQTYAGARVISTNTDGLFTVFEEKENAAILARESANIHVEIEPEYCYLVSKDSNNRIEIDENGGIIRASGGSLACHRRPEPTKSLAHAAIIDYALCEYLRNADGMHSDIKNALNEPFNQNKGRAILYNSQFSFPDTTAYLNMFQTMIASSTGSQTYIFGETANLWKYKDQICGIPFDKNLFNAACDSHDVNIMTHYNRVFFVKEEFGTIYGKPIFHLSNAAARVVTPAQKLTRKKADQILIQHDPYALAILEKYGLHEKDIPDGKEAKITKVSGIELSWYVYIENRSLYEISEEEKRLLIANLNIDNYLTLISESFDRNWSNTYASDGGDDNDAA